MNQKYGTGYPIENPMKGTAYGIAYGINFLHTDACFLAGKGRGPQDDSATVQAGSGQHPEGQ